ncbi:MAG: APC family permease [Solirubrobacterales bacterium]|nr:APC family permease [Solirubrobacterales bacterium]
MTTSHQGARQPAGHRSTLPSRQAIPLTQRGADNRLDDDVDANASPLGANPPPSPDAVLPALDPRQLEDLQEAGAEWGTAFDVDPARLPVDPSLGGHAELSPATRRGRLVQVEPAGASSGDLEATIEDEGRALDLRTGGRQIRRAVLGPPLKSTAIVQERMRKLIALPVLSADALSSVAYGPESMLAVLVLAGGSGLGWSLPVSAAIAFLMLAVGLSYRQTIRAYPHGGGSYIVAGRNLGRVPGLVAAGGLITDYVLTVAVSISSGLAAVTSAIPSLRSAVVPIGLALIAFLLAANLRGVRQAGALFAAPTYAFIVAIALLVTVGLIDAGARGFRALPAPALHASSAVTVLLVLRAFASGSTAMTGIEAISNAVPAFKPVEWRNARTTLTWMIGLLIAMFTGIVVLVHVDGIVPESSQTTLSQLAHLDFGSGPLYVYTQAATALVLLLAADTAYNDFPRVMFLLARDRFAPRPFLRMGDRLAFNNGIVVLSVVASLVFVAFGGNTSSLIPLYAVGVFLAFTLSQAGMVVHWWRVRGARWRTSMAIGAIGCAMSATVFLIAGITKFTAGAWVSLLIVLVFTTVALLTRRHFDRVDRATGLGAPASRDGESEQTPSQLSNLVIVPIPRLDRVSVRALAYAVSLRQPVLALHVSPTAEEARRFRDYWHAWGDHVPLELIESPYRAVIPPVVAYVESLHTQRPELTITVIVPDLAVGHLWQRPLHDDTGARLRHALAPLSKVVVASVRFHV